MSSEFQGSTVKWEMRILLAFMKLQNWIFAFFFFFSRAGPNTGESLLGVDSKSSSSGTMEIQERECPGKRGGDEGKTVWNSHKENLHISEHYTKQCKFYEV